MLFLQEAASKQDEIFTVILKIFQLIAWPAVVALAWKVSRWLTKMEAKVVDTADVMVGKLDIVTSKLDLVASNHLTHLQAAVEEGARLEDEGHRRIVEELKELRADIRAQGR